MGWGADAPPPDPAIAQAQQAQSQLARDQYKNYLEVVQPAELAALKHQQETADHQTQLQETYQNFNMGLATQYNDRYNKTFIPLQDQMIAQAQQYNSPDWQELQAGKAASDVEQASTQANAGLQRNLTARGINPGSGNAIAAMAGSRDVTATSRAQAINSTREAARQMGWKYLSDATSMGAGLPGATMGAVGGASAAGQASMGASNSGLSGATSTGQALTGGYGSVGQSYGAAADTAMKSYDQQLNAAQINNSTMNTLIGAGAGALTSYGMGGGFSAKPPAANGPSDIRLKKNIKRIGTTARGNPLYTWDWKTGGSSSGVIAQEVQHIPGAVTADEDGILHVDYDKV
jgi:hypothetical protein